MSSIIPFKPAGSVAELTTALRSIQPSSDLGTAILKMDKTGHWIFGADATEVEDDSTWAINPFSFVHGFIAWGDGEVLGEKMASVASPLPDLDEPPPGSKKGWEQQVGMSLACVSGDDAGLQVRYTTTSVGGKKAVQAIGAAIADQVDKDPTKPVPVVRLKKDHYQHKSYGKIFTPVFEVVEWVSMEGEAPSSEEPKRRRRPA
jgi:hypothetical protein